MDIKVENCIGKSIAVISDIHSNADSLQEAIGCIFERNIDSIVVLGDILTYGNQAEEVIELLLKLRETHNCWFVVGNHDEFYFNLQNDEAHKNYKVPDFIQESIQQNLQVLKDDLSNTFDWCNSISFGQVHLSHANPYSESNWSYVNSEKECRDAALELLSHGYHIGVFGHTHRKMNICINGTAVTGGGNKVAYENKYGSCNIINPGSIGQPRGEGASFLVIDFEIDGINLEHVHINPNLEKYLSSIRNSGLSNKTIRKLLSYFGVDE